MLRRSWCRSPGSSADYENAKSPVALVHVLDDQIAEVVFSYQFHRLDAGPSPSTLHLVKALHDHIPC